MKDQPQTYLGDGVYASFDGYHVWLHLYHHESPPLIALEPPVLAALIEFDKQCRELNHAR